MRSPSRTRALSALAASIAIFSITSALPAFGQKRPARSAGVKVATIAPRPEDVASIDSIIAAFYDVISGPAGRPRQWSRDRTLYIPEVKFISVEYSKGSKKPVAQVVSHQAYVDLVDASMVREGFFEREIHRVTQTFGSIAHVFSTYESRQSAGGPVIARGINSIELYNDGARWWITAAQWEDETPEHPIAKEFLP